MKQCLCGCGNTLEIRAGETKSQFALRRYVDRAHFNVARKNSGTWFKNKGAFKGSRAKGVGIA